MHGVSCVACRVLFAAQAATISKLQNAAAANIISQRPCGMFKWSSDFCYAAHAALDFTEHGKCHSHHALSPAAHCYYAALVWVSLPWNQLAWVGFAGAAILCCGKAAAAELQCLTAAPRLAVHEALSAPHKYLGTPYQISLSSKSDDACIAYQLFLEVSLLLLHIHSYRACMHEVVLP